MKEVMCIIRSNKMSKTKVALAKMGFPSITCTKVLGRGKINEKAIYSSQFFSLSMEDESYAESFSECDRLIPKRLITLVVEDEDVDKVVEIIIDCNSNGTPGDGKIFILPIEEIYSVRTSMKEGLELELE